MLRGNSRLLSLMLLSSIALAASAAKATPQIDLITGAAPCTDNSGAGISCTLNASISSPPINLVGVDNDKFRLDLINVIGTWTASIVVNDGSAEGPVAFSTSITGDGPYYLDFSDFSSTTFTSVTSLQLIVDNFAGPATNDSITVANLAAVPEPGTAGMLSLGLLGLAAGGRRREHAV